jgi:CheY-like chemotaxis protein
VITVRALLGDKFCILEANNSEQAIVTTKNNNPDLVLMDISLPGVDGISTLKIIRQNHKSGTISVVALTANALPEYKQMLLDNGFDACIVKPIDENLFFETINRVLYGK